MKKFRNNCRRQGFGGGGRGWGLGVDGGGFAKQTARGLGPRVQGAWPPGGKGSGWRGGLAPDGRVFKWKVIIISHKMNIYMTNY